MMLLVVGGGTSVPPDPYEVLTWTPKYVESFGSRVVGICLFSFKQVDKDKVGRHV